MRGHSSPLADSLPDDRPATAEAPSSVLLVTPRWARDGGVGAHVIQSAEALALAGVDVQVLTGRIEGEGRAGVTLHENPHLFDSRAPIARRIGDALASQPDVTHLHQVDRPELVEAIRQVAPAVVSAHGYTACTSGVYYFRPGHECTRGHGPGCIPNLIARGCAHTSYPKTLPKKYRNVTRDLAALRGADLAVSYSSAVDRHLANNDISSRRIVPYFPTMTPRQGSGHESRRRVVYAGRIVRPKGVGILISAAREVEGEFVICGDGRQLDQMRALASRLGIAERVHFKGWLSAQELADELANASVVAVPSLWPEPFGLVGIEALAAGRPAVASGTGGIVDWLEHGVSGLCVPPGDVQALSGALNELLADPQKQRAMGLAGQQAVASRFSIGRHLELLLEAYRSARLAWETGAGRRS